MPNCKVYLFTPLYIRALNLYIQYILIYIPSSTINIVYQLLS